MSNDRPGRAPAAPAGAAIDATLVQTLLRAQHPDLAGMRIEAVDSGMDNAMFRLGEKLAVRLPRREASAVLLAQEQRWLPALAARLPLPTPAPIRIGMPGAHYPWRWSVVPWLAGVAADQTRLRADQGIVLAQFLRALHSPAPREAPHNPYRGVALGRRAKSVEEWIERLKRSQGHIASHVQSIWRCALDVPIDVEDTWIHGDLHARNVLVDDGRLSAVIDWGDLCGGDPATDLAALWMWLPDPNSRAMAMAAYGASAATWQRARGWAVFFGLVLLEIGLADDRRHVAMGETTLFNLREDP